MCQRGLHDLSAVWRTNDPSRSAPMCLKSTGSLNMSNIARRGPPFPVVIGGARHGEPKVGRTYPRRDARLKTRLRSPFARLPTLRHNGEYRRWYRAAAAFIAVR